MRTTDNIPRRGFEYFVVQSRLSLYVNYKLSHWQDPAWQKADLVLASLLPARAFNDDAKLMQRDSGISETLLAKVGKGVLNDACIQMFRHRPYFKYASSAWGAFLELVLDRWTGRTESSPEENELLASKIEMCLKAGADPNVRRSCQSGRGENTALMWPIVLGAAALLDGHEGKPSSSTYRLAGLFLRYGANC